MYTVIALLILTITAKLATGKVKIESSPITADQIFGADKIYRVETRFKDEPLNVQLHLTKIRNAYKAYTKDMKYLKAHETTVHCVTYRIMKLFLEKKSELAILVKVYMTVKGIKDNGEMRGIQIDFGGKIGKMVVAVNNIFLPEAFGLKETFKLYFRCMEFTLPVYDSAFYVIDYQKKEIVSSIKDAVNAKAGTANST